MTLCEIAKHSGDCSCFGIDSLICDCGALRDLVRSGKNNSPQMWEIWVMHQAAVLKGNQAQWRAMGFKVGQHS